MIIIKVVDFCPPDGVLGNVTLLLDLSIKLKNHLQAAPEQFHIWDNLMIWVKFSLLHQSF